MIRTSIAIAVLFGAVLWLPLWVQLILFAVGVIVLRYRYALFLPAAFADALYAPEAITSVWAIKYTVFVAVLIVVHWLVVHTTRLKDIYAVETK